MTVDKVIAKIIWLTFFWPTLYTPEGVYKKIYTPEGVYFACLLSFFVGSSNRLPSKRQRRHSCLIRQMTWFRARKCLLGLENKF